MSRSDRLRNVRWYAYPLLWFWLAWRLVSTFCRAVVVQYRLAEELRRAEEHRRREDDRRRRHEAAERQRVENALDDRTPTRPGDFVRRYGSPETVDLLGDRAALEAVQQKTQAALAKYGLRDKASLEYKRRNQN